LELTVFSSLANRQEFANENHIRRGDAPMKKAVVMPVVLAADVACASMPIVGD
jgi:hypothetical protein